MRSSFLFRALLAQFVLFSLLGCSFLKDVSSEQCQTDNDCTHFGAYKCSSDKVCVASSTGSAGSGGDASGGSAGTGGMSTTPECTENSDCIDAHSGAPYICQEGACVSLTDDSGQCPFVIAGPDSDPNAYLTQAGKPIIIGAYVPIGVSAPESHPYTLTYRFALEEFMTGTLGGVGASASTPHRPIVMVLCQSDHPDLKASVKHLVTTLNVPGILASLDAQDLAAAFDLVAGRNVFLLGPEQADNALVGAPDNGLMWHVLGPTVDLLPVYGPLMKLAEPYVRANHGKSGTTPTTIAVVNTDESWSRDMATGFEYAVELNGYPLSDVSHNAANYQQFEVGVLNPGPNGPDVVAVNAALAPSGGHPPDIVVSFGGAEFTSLILPAIQNAAGGPYTPFYFLSPQNAFDGNLTKPNFYTTHPNTGFVLKASAGVNYASELDDTVYQRYLKAIQARFPGVTGLAGRENFYDAAYYMFYSLAAAAGNGGDFDGVDVAAGMKRLVQIGQDELTVGPGKSGEMFSSVLSHLNGGFSVQLDGAMGPPDFNLGTGARNSRGSAWCIDGGVANPSVSFDKLRLSTDQTMLTGDSFCFALGSFPATPAQ